MIEELRPIDLKTIDLVNRLKEEISGEYCFPEIKPSELLLQESRVLISPATAEWAHSWKRDDRFKKELEFFHKYFPELSFLKETISDGWTHKKLWVSQEKIKILHFLQKLSSLPEYSFGYIYSKERGIECNIQFPDVPPHFNKKDFSDWGEASSDFGQFKFGVPKYKKLKELPDHYDFHEDLKGHDGVANGGSYGWKITIYTNGKVNDCVYSDESTSQTGHRLNHHHINKKHHLQFSNHTWIMLKHWYNGLVYHYNTWYEGINVPSDWRNKKYNKINI